MVRTGYLHFALGIELVGVGGNMGMTVPYLFGSRIATISDLSGCQETFSGHCVLRGAFEGQPGRPSESPQQTLDKSSSECQGPSMPTAILL